MTSLRESDSVRLQDYCRFTLFDKHVQMSEAHKKLALAELVSPHSQSKETRVPTQNLQACAVNHLHGLGIIHRDIKLENVMLKNDGHVVLGNFGLALRLGAPSLLSPSHDGPVRVDKTTALKARGIVGTLPYLAPEMLRDMEYSYGVDWFAYGVFLHVFCMDKVRICFGLVTRMLTQPYAVSLAGKVRRSIKLSEGDDVYDIPRLHLREWGVRKSTQQGRDSTVAGQPCSLFSAVIIY